jgi:hypothetical protein
MPKDNNYTFDKKDFDKLLKQMINYYISNHKVSNTAHEEIMTMIHSDKKVAEYYYKREIAMNNSIKDILLNNNFIDDHLNEKIHIMLGLIDNLCHEIIYHKHKCMDYDIMTDLVIDNIKNLFKKDLV